MSARWAISLLAQVGDDEPLATQLVRALDARGEDGMALGGVGADQMTTRSACSMSAMEPESPP